MASLKKRGKTYFITASLGFKEDKITRIRKTATFTPPAELSEKQGRKAAEEFARDFEKACRGLTNYNDNMTLSELAKWYYTSIAPHKLKAQSLESYQQKINTLVLNKLGDKKLRDLKPAFLANYFRQLKLSGGRSGQPLSANSVKTTMLMLSAIFTAAVKAEIISVNPVSRFDTPKKDDTQHVALTPEQARLFMERLGKVENIGIRGLLLAALLTGARTGELRALEWGDINLSNGLININKSADRKGRVTTPKTKASNRIIRATPFLLNFLIRHRRDVQYYAVGMGELWTENNLVFPDKDGGYIGIAKPAQTIKILIKDTGIPADFHPHSLRHSFASLLIDSGADVKTVQEVLGHSSASMTLDVYGHSFAVSRARAMEAVTDAITGGGVAVLSALPYMAQFDDTLMTPETKTGVKSQKDTTRKTQKTLKLSKKRSF